MFRLIVPSCLALVVKGWITPSPPRSQFTRSTATVKSRVFDDDECFDLCPSESQPIPSSQQQQPPVSEATSIFDDDECLDLCPLEDQEPQLATPVTDKPKELTAQELEFKVDRDRIRLEMAYELFESKDDCDLDDISTCASQCDDCHGVGTTPCRFCMGTKSISHIIGGASTHAACPVCNEKGVEVCAKCRGSGQVASWTDLAKFNPGRTA